MSDFVTAPPPLPDQQIERPWSFVWTLIFGVVIMVVWMVIQSFTVLGLYLLSAEDPSETLRNLDSAALEAYVTDGDVLGQVSLISGGLTLILIFMVIGLSRLSIPKYLDLKAPNPLWVIAGIAATLGLNMGLSYLGPHFNEPEVNEFMETTYKSVDNLVVIWLGIAVMAPLFEEIFFRGFLYTGWSRTVMGGIGAAILTSGIWALIHIQYSPFIIGWIFVFGLVLCLARAVTGSIWVPIIMHIFNNGWATYWTGSAIAEGL